MGITNKEEFNLNVLCFENVIDGLNKYFAEDETRVRVPRSFVEVKVDQKPIFYRFDAKMYLDKLIAWLRTEHRIFYYPGMEAKYAKIERIPPLTERLMDEGALNSLKKLHKQVTGEEPEVDSHTLIADGISHAVSVKEAQIEELKERLDHKEAKVVGEIRVKQYEEELLDYIYKEYDGRIKKNKDCIRYSPSSVRNTIKKIISDYARSITRVEILETRIKTIFNKCKSKYTVDEYISDDPTISFMLDCIGSWLHSGATRDCIKMLAESGSKIENSDINQLISDFCAKNDVTPPAPYFSDESSVKYLFSVVDLERKHRAAVGKQMIDDYEKDIMNHIRQEASRNGYTLPEKVDGEPLTIERVFHDLLELMRIRGEEPRILKSKCDRLNEIVEELNTLNNEIKE